MKKIMVGNHAVSWGVMLARAEVISAYPITPQTTIVEELSVLCADGRLNAKFIPVESEHSAMACCIGAAAIRYGLLYRGGSYRGADFYGYFFPGIGLDA